jgi:hypothetical protein
MAKRCSSNSTHIGDCQVKSFYKVDNQPDQLNNGVVNKMILLATEFTQIRSASWYSSVAKSIKSPLKKTESQHPLARLAPPRCSLHYPHLDVSPCISVYRLATHLLHGSSAA